MTPLQLEMNRVVVGEIRSGGGDLSLSFSSSWMQHKAAFAPSRHLDVLMGRIYDDHRFRPVRWFIEALLPSGEARAIHEQAAGAVVGDDLDLLWSAMGGAMGAISLSQPQMRASPPPLDAINVRDLGLQIRQPLPGRRLLPGHEPKLSGSLTDAGLLLSEGAPETMVVAKAREGEDREGRLLLVSEWYAQALAHLIGLDAVVPELRRTGEDGQGIALFSAHFDRVRDGFNRQHKLCTVVGSQLAGVTGHQSPGRLSPALLREVIGACQEPVKVRREVFRWMVFNAVVGHHGLHLNKLAFIRWESGWQLAPFVGMRMTGGLQTYLGEDTHPASMLMIGGQRFPEAGVEGLVAVGQELGIKPAIAERLALNVIEAVVDESAIRCGELSSLAVLTDDEKAWLRWADRHVIGRWRQRTRPATEGGRI